MSQTRRCARLVLSWPLQHPWLQGNGARAPRGTQGLWRALTLASLGPSGMSGWGFLRSFISSAVPRSCYTWLYKQNTFPLQPGVFWAHLAVLQVRSRSLFGLLKKILQFKQDLIQRSPMASETWSPLASWFMNTKLGGSLAGRKQAVWQKIKALEQVGVRNPSVQRWHSRGVSWAAKCSALLGRFDSVEGSSWGWFGVGAL